jgi:hypothetical protein
MLAQAGIHDTGLRVILVPVRRRASNGDCPAGGTVLGGIDIEAGNPGVQQPDDLNLLLGGERPGSVPHPGPCT